MATHADDSHSRLQDHFNSSNDAYQLVPLRICDTYSKVLPFPKIVHNIVSMMVELDGNLCDAVLTE